MTFTITDLRRDGSSAFSDTAYCQADAFDAYAREEGFDDFASYCAAEGCSPADFAVKVTL